MWAQVQMDAAGKISLQDNDHVPIGESGTGDQCAVTIMGIGVPASSVNMPCLERYEASTVGKGYYDGCENENNNPCQPTSCEVRINHSPFSIFVQSRDCGSMGCSSCAWCRRHFNYDHGIKPEAFVTRKLWSMAGDAHPIWGHSAGCAAGIMTFDPNTLVYGEVWAGDTEPQVLLRMHKPGYNYCDLNALDGVARFNPCGTINPREAAPFPDTISRLELRPPGRVIGNIISYLGGHYVLQPGAVTFWMDTASSPILSFSCPAVAPQLTQIVRCGQAVICRLASSFFNNEEMQCHFIGEIMSCADGVIVKQVNNDTDCTIHDSSMTTTGGTIDQTSALSGADGMGSVDASKLWDGFKDAVRFINPIYGLMDALTGDHQPSDWETVLGVCLLLLLVAVAVFLVRRYCPCGEAKKRL